MTTNSNDWEWPIENSGWFQNFFSLGGRYRRREFLLGVMLVALLENIPIVNIVACIAYLALMSKRLHDMDLSGKWIFPIVVIAVVANLFLESFPMLSFILSILMLLISFSLLLIPGSKGINKYGSNPRRGYKEQCLEAGYPAELVERFF